MALDGKEQHKFLHASLKHLLGKPSRKGTRAKKGDGAAAAPAERKMNWWTAATKRAMPILKPILEDVNEDLVSGGFKKHRISCVTQFLGSLKEKGELSAEVFPADEVLDARFKSFLAAATTADSGSAASGGSGGSGKSKFSELTPDEQKARRSEAAKKAAATRAAKKAASAAGTGDE